MNKVFWQKFATIGFSFIAGFNLNSGIIDGSQMNYLFALFYFVFALIFGFAKVKEK